MFRILAQSYPNNETRVTFSSIAGGRDPSVAPDSTCVPLSIPDSVTLDEVTSLPSSYLSLVPNSKTERSSAGYGDLPKKPTRFGANARRSLLRSGGALEKVAPPEETLFLTGTLPGSTEDSFRAIAAYSGYIVNSLKAWISNYAPEKLDFYCWELQKRGALHLHYAVHIPDGGNREYILRAFHGWWCQVLHRVGDMAGVDMFRKNSSKTWRDDESKVRAVAEICRKSVARYLAKYLSKSSESKRGPSRLFTPSRWWGVSRPLKALTDAMTSSCEVVVAGYHTVRSVWEKVKAICDSSESVTYSYRHKVGEGSTVVLFTKEQYERDSLWLEIVSLQRGKMESSYGQTPVPSAVLKVVRTKQLNWLRESLTCLSPAYQGLSMALETNLNWTLRLTPSTSPEPLSLLTAWAARLADIRSLCQFTPVMNRQREREIYEWLDTLEWAIEEVAEKGWY